MYSGANVNPDPGRDLPNLPYSVPITGGLPG